MTMATLDRDPMAESDGMTAGADRRTRRRLRETPRGNYSRFVTLMKLVLPTVAVALVALVLVWPQLQSREGGFKLDFAQLKIGDAERLRMVSPRYTGRDENNLPYEVTADSANQDTPKADDIGLEGPKADMTLSDGTWIAIEAPEGNYGQKTQMLDLSGGVNLFHDSGYEFNSPTARVDLAKGNAEGHEPITGHGPFGEVEGEGFQLIDKGKTIIFTGKARVVLYPEPDAPGAASNEKPASNAKPASVKPGEKRP
ncbi:MAG TPA: LPS export ABC transporter periplasmic protein LptC [Alphaproteobacteria bacterium]|jgi:lipopolysaccharide export system protein LptC